MNSISEVRVDLFQVGARTVAVVSGVSADEFNDDPNLQESVGDMVQAILESGQRSGIIPADPKPAEIGEVLGRIMPPTRFGEKVRWLRKREQLTQAQAAERVQTTTGLKCTQGMFSTWECRADAPRGRVAESLAKAFKVRTSFFYEE